MTDRREQLLNAAQEIIQRRGYNAFSYQDLSDVINIRKASIHHHFPRKEDIGLTLIKRYTEGFAGILQDILARHTNPKARLEAYCHLFDYTLTSSNHEKLCLGGIMGAEMLTLPNEIKLAIAEFCRVNEVWLKNLIKAGIADGSFNPSAQPENMARLIFSSLEGGMLAARLEDRADYLRDIVRQLRAMLYAQPRAKARALRPSADGKARRTGPALRPTRRS